MNMNSGIHVNYMTRAFASYLQTYEARNQTGQSGSFRSVAERIADSAKGDLAETEKDAPFSPENMTMEEYKEYIYRKISLLAVDPSQTGWQWHIDITEEGFAAMKDDPAYEKYVLNTIRTNFSFHDPFQSRTYSILHFGAAREETRSEVMSGGSPAIPKEKEKSFWEERMERNRRFQKQFEKLQEKRALARKWGLPEPSALDIGALLEMMCGGEK